MNFLGTVVEVNSRGIYVESSINGQPARYGPMTYLSSDGIAVNYETGNAVLFTNIGRIADNFIILGKVIDPSYPPYEPEWEFP